MGTDSFSQQTVSIVPDVPSCAHPSGNRSAGGVVYRAEVLILRYEVPRDVRMCQARETAEERREAGIPTLQLRPELFPVSIHAMPVKTFETEASYRVIGSHTIAGGAAT